MPPGGPSIFSSFAFGTGFKEILDVHKMGTLSLAAQWDPNRELSPNFGDGRAGQAAAVMG
jgi:hypothetical protein